RDRRRRGPRRQGRRLLARDDQVDAALDETVGGGRHRLGLALGEADVEGDVAVFDETQLLESGLEPFDRGMVCRPGLVEDADAERPAGLLRRSRQWEHREEEEYETTPP